MPKPGFYVVELESPETGRGPVRHEGRARLRQQRRPGHQYGGPLQAGRRIVAGVGDFARQGQAGG
ncbi:hypothetical protein LP419_06700 [Massilia sp. H-1]|nr:hypothetical protein LP419_06700 [Massilia sp. H-1]